MAKNTIADLDTTAGNNTDILGQSTQGTAAVSTIDTMIQNALGMLARFYADLGGTGTVGGTADAITLTTASTYQALESGLFVGFKAGGTNTGATTINVDGLGAKAIRRRGDTALQAGDMLDDGVYLLRYDDTYNTAAGAWVLLNPEAAAPDFSSNADAVAGTKTDEAINANNLSAVRARRNLFDDSALQLSTVNGTTSGTTNAYELGGGWKVYRVTSAGTITGAWVASTTPTGAPNRNRITITVADATLAAGEYLIATKAIMGRELAHLKYGSASALQTNLRFLFKGPAGTYAYSIQNTAANRSYVGLFTPAAANTDEIITANIAGDQSGTWPVDTSLWTFNIVLAAGSTFQGTTGWQAGNILGTSAVSNGMGTGSAVFEFGELGWHADPQSTGVAPVWELPSYESTFGPTVELVGSLAASASASLNIDASTGFVFEGGYDYIFELVEIQPAADAYLMIRYGTGSTPTYQNTGYVSSAGLFLTTADAQSNTITTAVHTFTTAAGGVTAGETVDVMVEVRQPAANQRHRLRYHGSDVNSSGTLRTITGSGQRTTAEVLTGVQFLMSTGNITSGTIYVYRRKLS